MPRRRTSMNKLREIVRLHEVARMSQRQIARALNVSRPVVADTLTKNRPA
jgi:DNA-binding transcriptional regulator LsrR (DeoR family)